MIKKLLRPVKYFLFAIEALFVSKYNSIFHKNFTCNKNSKRCESNRKSPNFRFDLLGKNAPKCCVTNLYHLLKDITELFDKHNIEYQLCCGTLLGAFRHKGFIPWDTDVDLLVPESKKKEILNILSDKFNRQYYVEEERDDSIVGSLIKVHISKINSLHVDLYTYIQKNDEFIYAHNRKFKVENVYPLQKITFYNLKLSAPKNIEEQLIVLYGKDYMKYAYKQWALNKQKFKLIKFMPAKINL
ncbi:MAG: LicD family protein [Sulfurovum sp.]|nr:LicD family protein [Sulfurovum sp.]MCB4751416.1 LicD family protein [Sulfurovum sp.]MCB4753019.1 LicD family protein [Sulfurovum sp.]MCB4763028.1 LicD family protein [Sulfurovum sp.]MCB4783027.1 LicD family protein [Sulfurovum sp.]